ncbi:hypothetical protein Zm00014a_000379 [Zea mays]|jgi:hypothetical protein|uniref:Uncharacterized protein n=1 Tax=Zea mays TaxID=4577 RepID=A0A3L6F9Q6_MAIZE|nr:hypothetical protein Zm00014a_000379 [Zea mays]
MKVFDRLGLALDAAPDLAPCLLVRLAVRLDALQRCGLEVPKLLGSALSPADRTRSLVLSWREMGEMGIGK